MSPGSVIIVRFCEGLVAQYADALLYTAGRVKSTGADGACVYHPTLEVLYEKNLQARLLPPRIF